MSTEVSTTDECVHEDVPVQPDTLLISLETLCRIFNHPFSSESLVAGLPLNDGRLDQTLFIRAAERAGISAEIRNRNLDEIIPEILPIVLICKDGSALVLKSINDDQFVTIQYTNELLTKSYSRAEMVDCYSNILILVRSERTFMLDKEHENIKDKKPGTTLLLSVISSSLPQYLEVIIATLIINIFVLVVPLYVMNVYDRVIPNDATETLIVLTVGVFIVYIFDLLFKQFRSIFVTSVGKHADIKISSKLFERVLDIKRASQPSSVGSFASQIKEYESLREFISSATIVSLIDLPFVFMFIAMIFYIGGPYIALIPIATLPLVALIGFYVVPRLKNLTEASSVDSTRQHATLIETLTSLETVKAQCAESVMQKKWEYYVGRMANNNIRIHKLATLAINSTNFLQQAAYVLVVVVGVIIIQAGELTLGGLIACTILTGRAMGTVTQLASLTTRLHQAKFALDSLNNIMSMPIEHKNRDQFLHRDSISGDLRINNLKIAYPESTHASLVNVNITIKHGEKVGILGRVGSGKSTLAKALLGFYDPVDGGILFNGTDIRQIDPAFYRKHMGYVAQHPDLFSGSIKDNIKLSNPLISDDRLVEVARATGVLSFVNQQQEGFDYQVGEKGQRLSGGQKQLITIARALLHKPNILIMDEPTSFMDSYTEETLMNSMESELKDKTLILITHKASLLRWVERLIVMDNGTVILDGDKNSVITRLSGERT